MAILVERPWYWRIVAGETGHVLLVHVTSGHAEWDRPVPLTEAQAGRLVAEPRRLELLCALLDERDRAHRFPEPGELAAILDTVIFGAETEVSALLDAADARGGVSGYMAMLHKGRRRKGAADWFGDWQAGSTG